MKTINCFVAIAFNSELDNVYENGILIALVKSGITPKRVDRIPHNERIDFKIRTEINQSDFMIADLTYERPSVYWEAGYAERNCQVIYTCRKDHLEDGSGHIVHFDLRNANIIPWEENKLGDFINNLTGRINFITKPLMILNEREEKQQDARVKFDALSVQEQKTEIRKFIKNILHLWGYEDCLFQPRFPKYNGVRDCLYKRINNKLLILLPEEQYFSSDFSEFIIYDERLSKLNPLDSLISFFNSSVDTPFIYGDCEKLLSMFRLADDHDYKNSKPLKSSIYSKVDSIRKILLFVNKDIFGIDLLKKSWSTYKNGEFDFHLYDTSICLNYMPSGVEPYISHEILIFENIKSLLDFEASFSINFPRIEETNISIDRELYPDNILKL